jgi:hypothetical protein
LGFVRFVAWVFVLLAVTGSILAPGEALPADLPTGVNSTGYWSGAQAHINSNGLLDRTVPGSAPIIPVFAIQDDVRVKLAYGRTFGTLSDLDYATIEVSSPVTRYPAVTSYGSATGEVQMAFLASHVRYRARTLERLRHLDFHDGYELALLPKGRVTLPSGPLKMVPYLESGAGMSYVSETYCNSGSRFNWSLLAGMGIERILPGRAVLSVGLQWRHLSNGNMWGKGDELHNSNSGTDMVQGLAVLVQRF